jgi:excisionase family DNA binding protein
MAHEPVSYHVEDIPDLSGLTRTQTYLAIKSGELQSLKVGRRRLVRREALEKFLKAREAAGQPGRHGEANT